MHSTYEDALEAALVELRRARQSLLDEIYAYPTPISGCDAQFNRLLSDRRRISAALSALEDSPFIATPRQLAPQVAIESR